MVGGTDFCRRSGNGSIDIGLPSNIVQINHPVIIRFRVRGVGSGDQVVNSGGRIDWGDTTGQDIPIGNNLSVPVSHTYTTAGNARIGAVGWVQFKYQGEGGTLFNSGSYETCVDSSANIKITP